MWDGMALVLALVSGLLGLTLGGEALVRGALAAARQLGVSPLLAGLVIVGCGTSAPELVVSLAAAVNGQPEIAVGNILGSNVANILLILGLSGVILPLSIHRQSLHRDGLAMLGASLGFVLLASNGVLGFLDGVILLVAFLVYLIWSYRTEKVSPVSPEAELHRAEASELEPKTLGRVASVALVLGGFVLLIGGARLFLTGAVGLGERFGVPEAVIGLTLVAVGTSLPELAVTLVAVLRRHADVAVGNVLGSNLFNLLGILGVSALASPLPLAERMSNLDQWVMLGSASVLWLFLLSGFRLSRVESALLLLGYLLYLASMAL